VTAQASPAVPLRARAQQNRDRIRQAALLLAASEEAGTIRPGPDPDGVLLITGFLRRIDPRSDWRSQSGRRPDLLMDGLTAGAPGRTP